MTRLLTEQVYTQAMNEIVEPYLNAHGASFFLCREADRAIHVLLYRTKKPPRGTILVSHGFTENIEKYKEFIYYNARFILKLYDKQFHILHMR